MDVGNRHATTNGERLLRMMLRRFALTVAVGFAGSVAWEFLFDNAVHGILGVPPDSAAEHWRYVLYETVTIALVAAAYAYRIRYEQALEETLAKYTAVMQGASDAILIGDLDGNFIDANPQAERLLGRTRAELLTMNYRQMYPPEAVDAAEASFKRMLDYGVTRRADAYVIKADGTRIPVDVMANLIEISGKKRTMGILRDMSAQVRERNRLHLLETAINRASEMIVITDKTGEIVYANNASETITGYPPAGLIGKNVSLFKSGLHRPEFYRNMWHTLLKGGIWKGALVNRHAKGHTYEVEVAITPIFNGGGAISNFVSIQRDLTERKRLYEQVLHADKLSSIGTFMAGIAHELNNPLTVVIGYANDMVNDDQLPPRFTTVATNIRDQSRRAVEVVRNLLAYSRPNREGKEPIDLDTIVRQTVSVHQYRIRMDGVAIEYIPGAGPMTVKVSAGQIQQVLVNLIVNAHAAVRPAGKAGAIEVKIRRRDGWANDFAETIISNNGPPIPPELLSRIFDPYFTTKKAGEGTGLGLYICAQIVHEHGGDIWAENLREGGVAFHFTLPVTAEKPAAPAPEPGPSGTTRVAGSRVLVVDDESLVQTVVSQILLKHEIFPVMASNGAEAAKLLEEGKFDMILSDYKMPLMNGIELYHWLEQRRPEYVRRFVFHTGALDKDLLDFCGERGIPAIIKPAEPEAVVDTVASVIGNAGTGGRNDARLS